MEGRRASKSRRKRLEDLARAILYSEELGIVLKRNDDAECFKWFLASLLFGARIGETIAKQTYRAFERHDLLSPERILRAGRSFLVNPIMREGGYVRYDERKSTQIVRDCDTLVKDYGGSLKRLHALSQDRRDLEGRLLDFYGVGPVTVNIFLRELRPYWAKADPEPLPVVRDLAARYHVSLGRYDRKSVTFTRIEAGLIRMRKAGRSPGPD